MIESTYLEGNQKIMSELKGIRTLVPFKERDLCKLLTYSKIRKYKNGEQIISEGSFDGHVYILIYGRTKIVKKKKELAVLDKRGDIFGEMSLLGDCSRTASVFADNDVVCLAIDTTHINKLPDGDKSPIYHMLYRIFAETLSYRLKVTSEELISMKKKGLKFWQYY
jgi:CRP/FNR family transcriptional regulator, cyclic AMP receptor protein